MDKRIFEANIGKKIIIVLKPNNYVLIGTIDQVFDDCFSFTTKTQTSYLDFDAILSMRPYTPMKRDDAE
jgi:hypothetical protein